MKTKLFSIVLLLFFSLAFASATAISAPDGVTIQAGSANNPVQWENNGLPVFLMEAQDGSGSIFAFLRTLPNAAEPNTAIELSAANYSGTNTAKMLLNSPYATQAQIVLNYDSTNDNPVNVDTVIQGENDMALIYADASADGVGIGTDQPSEKLDVVGNIKASGTITGSNLSGTNTGDQTMESMLVTSLMGYSVPANGIVYTGPGLAGVSTATNSRVSMTITGSINKIAICLATAQPATGALETSIYVNNTLKSTYSIGASTQNGCYTSTVSVSIASSSRIYVKIENLASTSSASISAITFNILSQ